MSTERFFGGIRADHELLRRLLAEIVVACDACAYDEKAIAVARSALLELLVVFETHLRLEADASLPPLVDETVVTAMLEDARLGNRDTVELAAELRWFARGLERDITEEERRIAGVHEAAE